MFHFPPAAEPLIRRFSVAFTRPTFKRVVVLLAGVILTPGRRTVTHMLWTVRSLTEGHVSSYHRVLSRRRWSLWTPGKVLAAAVLVQGPQGQPVLVAMDDHATQHRGKNV